MGILLGGQVKLHRGKQVWRKTCLKPSGAQEADKCYCKTLNCCFPRTCGRLGGGWLPQCPSFQRETSSEERRKTEQNTNLSIHKLQTELGPEQPVWLRTAKDLWEGGGVHWPNKQSRSHRWLLGGSSETFQCGLNKSSMSSKKQDRDLIKIPFY